MSPLALAAAPGARAALSSLPSRALRRFSLPRAPRPPPSRPSPARAACAGLRAARPPAGRAGGLWEGLSRSGSLNSRLSSTRASSGGAGAAEGDIQRRVSHILVADADVAILDSLEERLSAGEEFADLAREHSKCPSGKRSGGDLGFLKRGQTVPDFEKVAFELPMGVVSRATTTFGVHLVRAEEERVVADVGHMDVMELKALLEDEAACQGVQFIDVREPREMELSALPKFQLLPLSEMGEWAPTVRSSLDAEATTVVLCHHGVRSMQASQFFLSQGFSDVRNVTGGIDAYSRAADASVPMY